MTSTADDRPAGRLARLVPALDWLGRYRRAWLRGDVVAAISAALVAPVAMGDVTRFGALSAALAILVGVVRGRPGRSGAAGLPAGRAAAVRQRQAGPGPDPGPAPRGGAAGPDRAARSPVHPGAGRRERQHADRPHRELGRQGIALWLANVRTKVQELLRRGGLADAIGEAHLYRTITDATPDVRAALGS